MKTSSPTSFGRPLARIIVTLSIGFVVTQLDVTIVNIALARIAADLHARVAGLQWIVDAYTLAFAVLMLSAGALGEQFGARRMYAGGMALFAGASLACGLAPGPATLVAARALQGVGAAAMLPNSLALLNRSCAHDPRLRARAVGLWTAAGAISIAAGPVVGGVLIAGLGWRSIFLVNLPLCAAGLLATLAWVPAAPGARRAAGARARGLDLPGQGLAVLALTAFTGAVIECRPLGLAHPLVVGSAAAALAAGVAFVVVESRAAAPMLPLALFRKRSFSAAVLFGICVNLSYYGMVFVLSLYLQQARGYSATGAGLAFLPLTGGFLVSNVLSGWVVARFGVRVPMIAGGATAALGYALLHHLDAATPLPVVLVAFVLIPSGMGLAVPAMTTAVLASVERQRAGIASAALNTARQAGGAIGVAAYGALASGAGAAHIVAGMQTSSAISAGLLIIGIGLACLIHPQAHAAQPDDATPAGGAAQPARRSATRPLETD